MRDVCSRPGARTLRAEPPPAGGAPQRALFVSGQPVADGLGALSRDLAVVQAENRGLTSLKRFGDGVDLGTTRLTDHSDFCRPAFSRRYTTSLAPTFTSRPVGTRR